MHFKVLSLFPEYIRGPLQESILKRAIQKELIHIDHIDIRDFSSRVDRRVDDRPFGGGPGMVMSPEPVCRAVRAVRSPSQSMVIHLSPQGIPLTAPLARKLSALSEIVLLCGHYEGIDQRALDTCVDMEISIGDYVLTNGCLAALVLIDAISRFIPGVLGDEQAHAQDSFEEKIFDCPHYTHPRDFEGKLVPEILLSGDHEKIQKFRLTQAITKTKKNRVDLILPSSCSESKDISCQFVFATTNVEKIRSFYEAIFGSPVALHSHSVFFSFAGGSIGFIVGEQVSSPELLHITISAEDFCRFSSRHRRAIIRTEQLPFEEETAACRLTAKDPDGRTIVVQKILQKEG